jgi:hypothetical protein
MYLQGASEAGVHPGAFLRNGFGAAAGRAAGLAAVIGVAAGGGGADVVGAVGREAGRWVVVAMR